MDFILNKKLKYYTKEILKYFNISMLAFGFIMAIILVKYKPMYKVSISGQELGYVESKQALEEAVKEQVIEAEEKNVDIVDMKVEPEYELKLVDKTIKTKEEEIAQTVEPQQVEITYKYYEIALNNEPVDAVDTLEAAEELVSTVKTQAEENEISILEKYTKEKEEVQTRNLEVAKTDIQDKVTKKIEEQSKQKEEQERIDAMPEINGIKLAYMPVTGTISSRYGVSSKLRKSTHTGLDIATKAGMPIKVVAAGTVTQAKYEELMEI